MQLTQFSAVTGDQRQRLGKNTETEQTKSETSLPSMSGKASKPLWFGRV